MAFLEKGHFVRIFGLSSKIRQLKKSTDGLFQQPDRTEVEKIVEERIAGTRVASMQVERALLEEFGHLLASQLETPDYHVRITHPLYLSEDSVVIPHLQIAPDASEMPALIIDFFNVQSRLTTAARLRLYERHRIREYWAIDLDTRELDRYVLLEGYYLPPHAFDLRTDAVFSVVFPELRLEPAFTGWSMYESSDLPSHDTPS